MGETVRGTATGEAWHCEECGLSQPSHAARASCAHCGADRVRVQAEADARRASAAKPGERPLPGDARPLALVLIAGASWVATWAWACVVLAVLLLIRWVGDGWWGVTVLLFLPRWLFLAPFPFLVLASGLGMRPRYWILQAVVALVIAGPLMLASLPVHRLWAPPVSGTRVRIMTYNMGASTIDDERLIRMIDQEKIDLICFQEGNTEQSPALQNYLDSQGWYRDRKRRYLASRYPIIAELPPLPSEPSTDDLHQVILIRARVRAAPGVEFGLASVHMPTLRFGLYRFFEHDVDGLRKHIAWWDHQLERLVGGLSEMRDIPFLVGGDFNVPSDHAGMAALGASLRFAHEDAGWGYGYTRPTRSPWFRIDHILGTPEWVFTRCWVGPDFGSDHLPLIADAVLPAPFPSPAATEHRSPNGRE
jgi:endonuclease/exonuclease/phosphatase family metal-dependent hydrolase